MNTVRVKMCGISNLEDALLCVRAGAHALGFIFAPSPRQVDTLTAQKITSKLPLFVSKVGVFMDAPEDEILRAAGECGLDYIQLHGNEDQALIDRLRKCVRVIKTVRLGGGAAEKPEADALLLDSAGADGKSGGTGRVLDWEKAAQFIASASVPVILAGGLNPENVASAISVCRPYGLDVCSGVEAAPGRKDPLKVEAFMRVVFSCAQ